MEEFTGTLNIFLAAFTFWGSQQTRLKMEQNQLRQAQMSTRSQIHQKYDFERLPSLEVI